MTPGPRAARGGLARALAASALLEVIDHGRSLGHALESLEHRVNDGRDRALIRRLCNRSLCDLPALQWRLGRLVARALPRKARAVHFLLLNALAELVEGREPAAAVIHASVDAARILNQPHLTRLVNGVLRGWLRQAERLEAELPHDEVHRLGYPEWLIDAVRKDWPTEWLSILKTGNRAPPLWLRHHRRRTDRTALAQRLHAAGPVLERPDWAPDALKLAHPARISQLPGYAEGLFSVQDAGAQAAADLLQLADGQRVLDACSAPGGKAAHILERARVELTAVELEPERISRIEQTLTRLGLSARVVVGDARQPASWWDGVPFDRILVDAPCTATGVIRRHPEIRWLRRPADIGANVEAQRSILDALWPLLAPGGLLVYVTCSILRAENRDQVESFLDRHADAAVLDRAPPGAVRCSPGAQILPGSLDRDGFFYAVLERL